MKEKSDSTLLGFLHTGDQSIRFCPDRIDAALSEVDITTGQKELLREVLHTIGNVDPCDS